MTNKSRKSRVNLYIEKDLLEFGKELAYVWGGSLSQILEDKLRHEHFRVSTLDAEQYLKENEEEELLAYMRSEEGIQDQLDAYDEYLKDQEEAEFCRNNPDHPRAKLRLSLLKQRKEDERKMDEEASRLAKEYAKKKESIIRRWNETFKK